jgi:hypothetical protein
MNKRIVVSFLATALLVSVHLVQAQQVNKAPLSGWERTEFELFDVVEV